MLVVRTVPADHPDVDALLDRYFEERESTFPPSQGVYRRKRTPAAEFIPPNGTFVAVYDEETAVGCGGLRRIADDAATVRYEVKHVFVAPEQRGKGAATLVMDVLEEAARTFGADVIVLDTNDALTAAGALYRSRGYERTEAFNDNPNATTWYRKALG